MQLVAAILLLLARAGPRPVGAAASCYEGAYRTTDASLWGACTGWAKCEPGHYCSGMPLGERHACPAGRYSDSTGATECKACPVGTVGIGRRATSGEEGCVPCANGTFSLAEAATACMACPTEVELDDEGEEIPPPDGCPPVDSAAAPLPRAALTALLLLCVCRLRS